MIQSLVFFHGIEVDALYLILEDIFSQAGRVSTKMLWHYCAFDYENGTDDTGWTDISDFTFMCVGPEMYEVIIKDPYPIEPIKYEDIKERRREWMISAISQ